MAADSSITYPGGTLAYGGIKVLDVPVLITAPPIGHFVAQTGRHPRFIVDRPGDTLYEHTAALCFTGGYFGAFLVKEVIGDMLTHLRTIDAAENISFEAIARLAFKFYSHVCVSLTGEKFSERDKCQMLLAGYCPVEKRVRLFHLMMNSRNVPSLAEGLTAGAPFHVAIGSGAKRFDELFDADLKATGVQVHFQIPKRIRDVIREGSHGVAGTLQFADFDETTHDCRLFGVVDRSDDPAMKPRCFIRGTDLNQAIDQSDNDGLHVHYDFFDPFVPR